MTDSPAIGASTIHPPSQAIAPSPKTTKGRSVKYGGNGPWVFNDNPDRGYIRELMDDLRRAVESRKGFCARTCAFERHSHPNLHLTEITKHLSWPR
jgi:hypothetical protein